MANHRMGPELNLLNIWKQEDLKMVDLLHMDIQGSELSVIRQLEKSTLINKVDVMVIATHSDFIHNEIKNILHRNSFEVKHEDVGDATDGFLIGSKKINKNTKKVLT
jgi:spore coat polysaccharide biosynthesis protein SpsF (cytidylyltransferase family)